MQRLILLTSFLVFSSAMLFGQTENDDLVQFTGVIMDSRNLQPIPYAAVFDLTSKRGTYSDEKGFFTIVAEIADTIEFSFIGYATAQMVIPDTLEDNRYSIVQLLSRDAMEMKMRTTISDNKPRRPTIMAKRHHRTSSIH